MINNQTKLFNESNLKEIDFIFTHPPEIFVRLNPNWQERKCRVIIWWQGAEIVPGKKSGAGLGREWRMLH